MRCAYVAGVILLQCLLDVPGRLGVPVAGPVNGGSSLAAISRRVLGVVGLSVCGPRTNTHRRH